MDSKQLKAGTNVLQQFYKSVALIICAVNEGIFSPRIEEMAQALHKAASEEFDHTRAPERYPLEDLLPVTEEEIPLKESPDPEVIPIPIVEVIEDRIKPLQTTEESTNDFTRDIESILGSTVTTLTPAFKPVVHFKPVVQEVTQTLQGKTWEDCLKDTLTIEYVLIPKGVVVRQPSAKTWADYIDNYVELFKRIEPKLTARSYQKHKFAAIINTYLESIAPQVEEACCDLEPCICVNSSEPNSTISQEVEKIASTIDENPLPLQVEVVVEPDKLTWEDAAKLPNIDKLANKSLANAEETIYLVDTLWHLLLAEDPKLTKNPISTYKIGDIVTARLFPATEVIQKVVEVKKPAPAKTKPVETKKSISPALTKRLLDLPSELIDRLKQSIKTGENYIRINEFGYAAWEKLANLFEELIPLGIATTERKTQLHSYIKKGDKATYARELIKSLILIDNYHEEALPF